MKKALGALLAVGLCAGIMFGMAACSGGTSSSSSSSSKSETMVVTTDNLNMDPFYVMLIGNDSRYQTSEDTGLSENDPSFSDVNMLVRIDPKTYRISLLTLPRDTAIQLDGKKMKLNDSHYAGGPEGLVKQVEQLTGKQAAYYFDTTFVGYADLVDDLEGVSANVPFDMSVGEVIHGGTVQLKKGNDQTLKGTDALGLSRQRQQYANDGDACRQIKSRESVANLIKKVAHMDASTAGTYAKLIMTVCKTNMSEDTLASYIKLFMDHADQITFQMGTGPYSGGIDDETQAWMVQAEPETYAQLTAAMENNTPMDEIVPLPVVERKAE